MLREKFQNAAVAFIGALVFTNVSIGAVVGPPTATANTGRVSVSAERTNV